MKKIVITLLILSMSIGIVGQHQCNPPQNLNASVDIQDVTLSWNSPGISGFLKISEKPREKSNPYEDSSSTCNEIVNFNTNRDLLDLQFSFPVAVGLGEAGVESDGLFIYSTMWNDTGFHKYNIDGTYIGYFMIDGVMGIRDLAYAPGTGYFYGANASPQVFGMDFNSQIVTETILAPAKVRAIAYNDDNDSFYANDWSSDIIEFDRVTGTNLSSFPVGTYSSYYGFAYDNWSDGGPYLWGFSQDGSGAELVQIQLPGGLETGFVADVHTILGGSNIAGGLFTQPDIVPGYITIGGMLQNELIFGLELSGAPQPPVYVLAGYNIYKDDILINPSPYYDTVFYDTGLNPGTYNYTVTAIYNDTLGSFYCESDPAGPVSAVIDEQMLLGGNVFAGYYKLDEGSAHAYKVEGSDITHQSSVSVDYLGYYFFFPLQSEDFYVVATPAVNSTFFNDHIPTYYGNAYHWEDSPTIHLANNIYNADINLIELSSYNSGTGYINGNVFMETKENNNSPAIGVLMLLLNSSSECIAKTYTNDLGYFNFDQLGDGTYKLLCEIVGKKMNPLTFILNNSNPSIDNMTLVVMEDEVVMGLNDQLPDNIEYISDVIPNPVISNARIDIDIREMGNVRISVFDITGKEITFFRENIYPGMNTIDIPFHELSQGVYFVKLFFGNKSMINRKFIKL